MIVLDVTHPALFKRSIVIKWWTHFQVVVRLRLVCLDTDDYKYLRFERIVEQMKQAQGITEQLKAENQMEWVARMNNM